MFRTIALSLVLVVVGAIDFFCLLVSYWFLRLVRISARWVTWLIGFLIASWGVWLCAVALTGPVTGSLYGQSNLIGGVAFLIAVFSASQWTMRRWYLLVKRFPDSLGRFIARRSRDMLLFLRDHHQFFGWLVLLTATAHAVVLLPVISRVSQREVITGVIALGALAALCGLGEWIELAVRRKRLAPNVRLIHSLLTLVFLVAFAFHA